MRNITLWNEPIPQSPWRALFDIQRNLDKMYDDKIYEEHFYQPACEMEESDTHFVVNVDMPGIPKKDIRIELKDDQLHIEGERKSEKKNSTYSERYYGKFHRVLTLPTGVDADKIEANYEDGVLSLVVPKAEMAKPKQIKISDGKSSLFGKLLGTNKEEEKDKKTVSSTAA